MSDGEQRLHDPDALRAPTVQSDGRRRWIYPDRRNGPWAKKRRVLGWILITAYLLTPFLSFQGLPLLRCDLASGVVFALGQSFRFSETYYLVFVLIALALLLAWATSLFGRIWCGHACPQTVFLDWLIRPIEEFWEGPAIKRKREDKENWKTETVLKKGGKHLSFVIVILLISHAFLGFFVDPALIANWVRGSPTDHPAAFAIMALVFTAIYFDLIWFREQFCSFVCPYARFQSLMISAATPTVAYDAKRGEPRGKRSLEGSCIDCGLCARVCPTGIDIRNGLQLECIQCMRCADACDSVMDSLKRPRGLIRMASQMELEGRPQRSRIALVLRPRPTIYFLLCVATIAYLTLRIVSRPELNVKILRQEQSTFVRMDDGQIANFYTLRVVNQSREPQKFSIRVPEGVTAICPLCDKVLLPNAEQRSILVLKVGSAWRDRQLPLFVHGIADPLTVSLMLP